MTMLPDQLADFHAICALKYRYARALDTHDWDLLDACFTDDIVLWPGGKAYIAHGRDKVMELVKALVIESFYSSHIVTQPEIEFVNSGFAKGIWRMNDALLFTGAHPAITHMSINGGELTAGASIYYDEYTKIDDEWRISNSGYRRIFEVVVHPGADQLEIRTNIARGSGDVEP